MKVIIKSRTSEELEEFDFRDHLTIEVDGKIVFDVSDGEPEDGTLSRDFCDCFSIGDLMEMAYNAGKNGESFELQEN
jgi:hypothetical protein